MTSAKTLNFLAFLSTKWYTKTMEINEVVALNNLDNLIYYYIFMAGKDSLSSEENMKKEQQKIV